MKKLLCMLLVTALAGSVCACGGSTAASGQSTSSAESQIAASESQSSPAAETQETEASSAEEAGQAAAEEAVPDVTFETIDLDGNKVSSKELFAAHKLTMVNLWGTYCGPCIREMPDLEVLRGRLEEKDCSIVGIVFDIRGAADQDTLAAAQEIIAETGVTYQNLLPFAGLGTEYFPAEFIPTTYFGDENGRIVGEAAVGSRGADEYEALIDTALELLGD